MMPTRQRIVSAAGELFYSQGIWRTTMDGIAEAAQVTKRTVYHHFRSKDDLVEAWLTVLDDTVIASYSAWLHAVVGPVEDRILHMFERMAEKTHDPKWKGCGFARAANELAGLPGHPGVVAAKHHRKRFEGLFARELADDGIPAAPQLARRVMLLLDGAIVQALIHHDPAYVLEAGHAAYDLIAGSRIGSAALPVSADDQLSQPLPASRQELALAS